MNSRKAGAMLIWDIAPAFLCLRLWTHFFALFVQGL